MTTKKKVYKTFSEMAIAKLGKKKYEQLKKEVDEQIKAELAAKTKKKK